MDNSVARKRLQANYSKPVTINYTDPDKIKGINHDTTYHRENKVHYGDQFPDVNLFSVKADSKYDVNLSKTPHHWSVREPFFDRSQTHQHVVSRKHGLVGWTNTYYGIPHHDIVIENPAGKISHAEGVDTKEDFMKQNWQKEPKISGELPDFMNDPRTQAFINCGKAEAKGYTEKERQEEHKEARGVKIPLIKKSALPPVVIPAFEETKGDDSLPDLIAERKRKVKKPADPTLDEYEPSKLLNDTPIEGIVSTPKLSQEVTDRLHKKIEELESQSRASRKYEAKGRERKQSVTMENIVEPWDGLDRRFMLSIWHSRSRTCLQLCSGVWKRRARTPLHRRARMARVRNEGNPN